MEEEELGFSLQGLVKSNIHISIFMPQPLWYVVIDIKWVRETGISFCFFRFVGLLHSGTFIRGVGFEGLGCEVGICGCNFSKLCLFWISDCIFLGEATGLFFSLYMLGNLIYEQGKVKKV